MAKYHLSPITGNPASCKAKEGNCPFKDEDGSPAPHYPTKAEARKSYEESMASQTFSSPSKVAEPIKPAWVEAEDLRMGDIVSDTFDFGSRKVQVARYDTVYGTGGYDEHGKWRHLGNAHDAVKVIARRPDEERPIPKTTMGEDYDAYEKRLAQQAREAAEWERLHPRRPSSNDAWSSAHTRSGGDASSRGFDGSQ